MSRVRKRLDDSLLRRLSNLDIKLYRHPVFIYTVETVFAVRRPTSLGPVRESYLVYHTYKKTFRGKTSCRLVVHLEVSYEASHYDLVKLGVDFFIQPLGTLT